LPYPVEPKTFFYGWQASGCLSGASGWDLQLVLQVINGLLVELLANWHRKRKNHPPAGKDIASSLSPEAYREIHSRQTSAQTPIISKDQEELG
jgi:hypothetical protein